MMTTNIILAVLMITSICIAGVWALKNRRSFQFNQKIAAELDDIIVSTIETMKSEQSIKKKSSSEFNPASINLESPEMLSTLVTVLVNKYGNVKLDIKDFMISDSDYVSVYVDTVSQEIILSLDHTLGEVVPYTMPNHGNPDDTFH